jgi:ketosteroid isomerase-like protein
MQATNIFVRHDGEWKLLHHHASAFATESPEDEEPVN